MQIMLNTSGLSEAKLFRILKINWTKYNPLYFINKVVGFVKQKERIAKFVFAILLYYLKNPYETNPYGAVFTLI